MRIFNSSNKLGILKKIVGLLTKFINPITLIVLVAVVVIALVVFNNISKNKDAKNAAINTEINSPKTGSSEAINQQLNTPNSSPISTQNDLNSQNWVSKKSLNLPKNKGKRFETKANNAFSVPNNTPIIKDKTEDLGAANNTASALPLPVNVENTAIKSPNLIQNNTPIKLEKEVLKDNNAPNTEGVVTVYKMNSDDKITIKTSDKEDIKVIGRQGALIILPPKAFDLPENSPVELTVKEFYKVSDAILGNLNTQVVGVGEEDALLVSGGMMFIDAQYQNKSIKLNKEAQILMPNTYLPSENVPENEAEITSKRMQVFVADTVNSKNKTFKWRLNSSYTGNYMLYKRQPSVANKIKELKKEYAKITDLCGCDRMFIWKMYYNYRYQKVVGSNKKIRVKDSMFLRSDVRPQGFTYVGINTKDKLSPFCKELAVGADSTRTTLGFDWKKRHKSLDRSIYDGMGMYSKYYVKPNFKHMTRQERRDFVPYYKLRTDISAKIDTLKGIEKYLKWQDKFYEEQIAALKKREKEIFATDNKNKTLNNLDDVSYYIFATNKLGYINCDYFSRTLKENLVACQTNIPQGGISMAKLIFKNERVILNDNLAGDVIGFKNIPKGEAAIILIMKQETIKNGDSESTVSYLAMKEINTSTPTINLQFERMTPDELKAKIKLLDNNAVAETEKKVVQ